MPLSINVGLSRKASKDYQSTGVSINVMLHLLQDGKQVDVGNVTIPPSAPILQVGGVIEVRYLYAYPGGSLFQPVFLGVREDVGLDACTVAQLKFKAEESDEV